MMLEFTDYFAQYLKIYVQKAFIVAIVKVISDSGDERTRISTIDGKDWYVSETQEQVIEAIRLSYA